MGSGSLHKCKMCGWIRSLRVLISTLLVGGADFHVILSYRVWQGVVKPAPPSLMQFFSPPNHHQKQSVIAYTTLLASCRNTSCFQIFLQLHVSLKLVSIEPHYRKRQLVRYRTHPSWKGQTKVGLRGILICLTRKFLSSPTQTLPNCQKWPNLFIQFSSTKKMSIWYSSGNWNISAGSA